MGFTCGLYKSRKFRYTSIATMSAISNYLSFIRNNIEAYEGYTKDFEGYEKFCKEVTHSEKYKCISCFSTILDWYIANGEDVFTTIETWCSGAIPFNNWLKEEFNIKGNDDYSCSVELSEKDLFKCLKWCESYLDRCEIRPIVTTNAYRENEDETITLIPCDGVEYQDEEGSMGRTYSSTWDCTELYIVDNYYAWEYETIKSIKNVLIDILENTDFEHETISYDGGW